jgi:hypothetical protein
VRWPGPARPQVRDDRAHPCPGRPGVPGDAPVAGLQAPTTGRLLLEFLQISEAALGPDHPDIGTRRSNLGRVLADLGDLTGARTQLERALQISEAALSPDHPQARSIRESLDRQPDQF